MDETELYANERPADSPSPGKRGGVPRSRNSGSPRGKISRFSMVSACVFLCLAAVFCAYDIALIALCPGTLLDNLTSFSHIWLLPAALCAACGVYGLKTGRFLPAALSRKTRILCAAFLGFCAAVFLAGVVCIVRGAAAASPAPEASPDFLILLGGGVSADGRLPPSVLARVRTAAGYLSARPETLAVVTGGTLKFLPHPEAPAIRAELIREGVSPDSILMEDKALDTIQNFRNSALLLAARTGLPVDDVLASDVVVVTNGFHMARAMFLAERFGFSSVTALPAKTPAFYVPHLYVREVGAWAKLLAGLLVSGGPRPLSSSSFSGAAAHSANP